MEVAKSDIDDLSNIYVGIASVLASVVKNTPESGQAMPVLLSASTMLAQLRGAGVLAPLSP